MRSSQREAIIVLLHLLDRDLPSANRMALFAIRSKLALVNVRVAILTTLSDVSENRLCVALDARDSGVHSAQRVLGLVVIELRDGANRLPRAGRVAVLARDIQIPVGAVRPTRNLSVCAYRHAEKRNSDRCSQIEYAPRFRHDVPRLHNVDINRQQLKKG